MTVPFSTVSRDDLQRATYGDDDPTNSNALDASVYRLRRLLASNGALVTVECVKNVGYRMKRLR